MKRSAVMIATVTALSVFLAACGGKTEPGNNNGNTSALSGTINIDGSSTVYPITAAVAEEFMAENKGVKVNVGISGSSGGFKKWVKQEIDINNSSRKIKQEEIDEAEKGGFGHVELPVAYDGLSVIVNKDNTFLKCITKAELNKIWAKDSKVTKWNEVNPAWPAEEIKLYGPGTDSGTFEYFTEFANGKAKESRADYTASEDDNVLVQGVSGNKGGLGYFGYAYYLENKDKVKAVAVDSGDGTCIEPNDESIKTLKYPIARHIYIYPTEKSLERPEVKAFVNFYLENAETLALEVGYTPLTEKEYQDALAKVK